jgi:DNA-binding MarR family transcriptional regulator
MHDGLKVEWLSAQEQAAWRGLVEVFADVRAVLDAELVATQALSEGDYGVLVQLSEAKARRLRMCDLAARLHLSPSGLTRRLDGLVERGFVSREPSPDDRRAIYAVLTGEGMQALERAAPGHVRSVRREFFDHLSPEQVCQLAEAMTAVRQGRETCCGVEPQPVVAGS